MIRGVSRFSYGTGFPNASGYPLFLSVAEADNTFARAYTVIRALREKPFDTPYFHTRNIRYLTRPNNKIICQTVFEAFNGVSCNLTYDRRQVASIPVDSPSSPTVDSLALFIVCANYLFVSPTGLPDLPYTVQYKVTQINAIVVRVMSNSSEAGVSVFNYTDLGAKQRFTRVLIML